MTTISSLSLDAIDARLAEIAKALAVCAAATPGPWVYPHGGAVYSLSGDERVFSGEVTPPDAAFIARARNGWYESLRNEQRLLWTIRRILERSRVIAYGGEHAAEIQAAWLASAAQTTVEAIWAMDRDRSSDTTDSEDGEGGDRHTEPCSLFPDAPLYHEDCGGKFCAHHVCQECGAVPLVGEHDNAGM